MKAHIEIRCRNCAFWYDDGDDRGECRRYAPRGPKQYDEIGDEVLASFPSIKGTEWCGEYNEAQDAAVRERGRTPEVE